MISYANSIKNRPIMADRAVCDAAGNDIASTYAEKAEVATRVEVTTSNTFAEVEAIIAAGNIPYIKGGYSANQQNYICNLAEYIPSTIIMFCGFEQSLTDLKVLDYELTSTGWHSYKHVIIYDH